MSQRTYISSYWNGLNLVKKVASKEESDKGEVRGRD